MIDVITHCQNTAELRDELDALGFETIPVTKTPSQRSDNETLALCRVDSLDDLAQFECLTVLGTYDEVLNDPEKRAIYERIYPTTPVEWIDEDGQTQTYTPPEKFGVFA